MLPDRPRLFVRICHLGMAAFGILAILTGELAKDHESSMAFGYYLHGILGTGLTVCVLGYLVHFFFGPYKTGYRRWLCFTRRRIGNIRDDLNALIRCKLPEPKKHEGLAELVQVFGLVLFVWIACSGILLLSSISFGGQEPSFLKPFIILHKVVKPLLFMYLAIHIGATVLHTLAGHRVLGNIFSLRK